jgi:hypothetical protein
VSDDATPRLSLPYLAAAQAQKHVTMNAALALLDGLVQTAVESRSTAAEPTAPTDGAIYILPAGATGADWAGQAAGTLMRFEAGAWSALQPEPGWLVYVKDEGVLIVQGAGGAWGDVGLAIRELENLSKLGVGTAADAVNLLSVKTASALFSNLGADLRITLNKAASANTGSVLLQTGFSGRAEIGLCGDDDLHLKVSPDGAAWSDALVLSSGSNARATVDGALRVKSFPKAALPAAAGQGAGAIVFVSDDVGGATLAFSDGTAWRRVADLAVVA